MPPRLPREVGGYRLGRQLGSGSFGEVYHGRRGSEEVAIKLERSSCRRSQLIHEWKLYSTLAGGTGIPQVYWYGTVGKYNAMVMELLGPSLEDLFRRCCSRFSVKTALMCADQMLQRLQHVHARGVVHRDIKPNNFLVGRGEHANQIYIVDFGLSKTYLDRKTRQHVPYRDGRKGLTGTARYTSIGNHLGVELTRRDDLEGLGYVLLRMLRGTLPWQGIKAETKQLRNDRIKAKKVATTIEELCDGVPEELAEYLATCRNLEFDEEPPYDDLRNLMREALMNRGYKYDLAYDWSGARQSDVSTSASDGTSEETSTYRRRESPTPPASAAAAAAPAPTKPAGDRAAAAKRRAVAGEDGVDKEDETGKSGRLKRRRQKSKA